MKLWEIVKKVTEGEIKSNECKYFQRYFNNKEKIVLAIENCNIVFYDGDCDDLGDQDFVLDDFTADWEEIVR